MGEIEAYIRAAAIARGIDPDVAVAVAQSEGGLSNPIQQSNVSWSGGAGREPSYGPFQLYMGGGLGNEAMEAGIDPRTMEDWKAGVDFALDHAAKRGWGAWHGAANTGIGDYEGISLTSVPAMPTGMPPVPSMPPGSPPEAPVAEVPEGGASAGGAFGSIASLLEGGLGDSLMKAVGGGGGVASEGQITPSSIGSEVGAGGGGMAAAAQLMAAIMAERRKRYGTQMSGRNGV